MLVGLFQKHLVFIRKIIPQRFNGANVIVSLMKHRFARGVETDVQNASPYLRLRLIRLLQKCRETRG